MVKILVTGSDSRFGKILKKIKTNQDFIFTYLDSQSTGDQSFQSSFSFKLNANDYVEFIANTQTTATYSAGPTWNSCTGYLVG